MQFALTVNTSLINSYSAFNFAKAAIQLKHSIAMIFFYQQGVHIANAFINLPQDEINMQQNWQIFSREHAVKLAVCSGSALREGIPLDQLATCFVMSSLGQLTEVFSGVDRIVNFK